MGQRSFFLGGGQLGSKIPFLGSKVPLLWPPTNAGCGLGLYFSIASLLYDIGYNFVCAREKFKIFLKIGGTILRTTGLLTDIFTHMSAFLKQTSKEIGNSIFYFNKKKKKNLKTIMSSAFAIYVKKCHVAALDYMNQRNISNTKAAIYGILNYNTQRITKIITITHGSYIWCTALAHCFQTPSLVCRLQDVRPIYAITFSPDY